MIAAMDSLKQYLDLYRDHRALIDDGSAPAMNALRPAAFASLQGTSLPRKGDEGYARTDIAAMFAPDYGINLGRTPVPTDIAASFRCDVPNLSTLLAVTVGDTFVPTDTLVKNLPEGVKMMSLKRAATEFPDLVARYYGKIAGMDNPATALNTLLAQDGTFIYIPDGTHLQKPLQLVNILAGDTPMMALRRILIVAGRNTGADIITCDHTQTPETRFLTSQTVEIHLGSDADISLLDLEESSAETSRINQVYARLESGANLTANVSTLVNGTTRNEFDILLAGPEASARLYGTATGSATQHIDNRSRVTHRSPRATSDQLFRYVLDDRSTGSFEGGIDVEEGAHHTVAYQSNGNILASPHARMHTEPHLLIYNDDVKCSHGASTGQLDQSALFYMETRGIPRREAKTMLMQAFLAEALQHIRPLPAKDRLIHLLEKRFAGELATCGHCTACK